MEAKKNPLKAFQIAHAVDYLSDMSNDDADIDDHGDAENGETEVTSHCHSSGKNSRFFIVNSVIKSALNTW
jgi:hypothetical protein